MSLYTGLQLAADQKLAGLIVMSGIILINISVNNVCLCFFKFIICIYIPLVHKFLKTE